jgi:hypothetical protein
MILNHISEQRKVEGLERAGRVIVHHVQFGLANLNNNNEIGNKNIASLGDQRLHSFQHQQNAREN